ncbi:hypothetical protein ACN47E_005127 [Coniothyrium glycines]
MTPPTPPSDFALDTVSHPHTFQTTWKTHPDPHALPFPRSSPPFPLTPIDWHQLSLTDSQFTPHSWPNLTSLISANRLEELKRWPSALKAYLAWTAHVKHKYGSATTYLLSQRLFWARLPAEDGEMVFETKGKVPLGNDEDFAVLRNDWPYAFADGVRHIVVWSKQRLPVDAAGALSEEGKTLVEQFVRRVFREAAGEGRDGVEEGEKVLWFKNSTNLQSVRSLEHFHVLVRGVSEDVLREWMV